MFRVVIHEHVSAEHLDGLLDELAEMGATVERDPEGFVVVPKKQNEQYVRDFLLQEDRRGNLTIVIPSDS